MSSRALRSAAAAGAAGALISIITSLAVPAGLMSDDSSPTWNTIDLVTDILLIAGLAGFTAGSAHAGGTLHPVSVPLTGMGMLLTGVATIRTRHWDGWRRLAPLLCGVVPFAVELPGFIAFGDSTALHYFIACTWTAWLILFTALWSQSRRPDHLAHTMAATAVSQARS